MRLDPESILASPEKAELVAAIERAIVARQIEAWGEVADRADLDPAVLDGMLLAVEHGKVANPDITGKFIALSGPERQAVKSLAARGVAARGGTHRG